jgi:hypothetical protein
VPLLGAAAVCLPCLTIWSVRRTSADGWTYVAISILPFVALSLCQLRWMMYAQILMALTLAELVARCLVRPHDPGYRRRNSIMNAALLGGCFCGLTFSGPLAEMALGSGRTPIPYSRAALQGVCEYLATAPRWQDRPQRILTHIDLGSEVLYRTPHEVIGTCYQRNARGILDTLAILRAPSVAEALALLRGRQVDLILVPRPEKPAPASPAPRAPTFQQRLLQNDVPDWCAPVALPEPVARFYALFEVAGSGAG